MCRVLLISGRVALVSLGQCPWSWVPWRAAVVVGLGVQAVGATDAAGRGRVSSAASLDTGSASARSGGNASRAS